MPGKETPDGVQVTYFALKELKEKSSGNLVSLLAVSTCLFSEKKTMKERITSLVNKRTHCPKGLGLHCFVLRLSVVLSLTDVFIDASLSHLHCHRQVCATLYILIVILIIFAVDLTQRKDVCSRKSCRKRSRHKSPRKRKGSCNCRTINARNNSRRRSNSKP